MDSARAVLADVRSRGVEMVSSEGTLRWRPAFLVAGPLRLRVQAFKEELAELLERGEAGDRCPSCGWPLDSLARCPKCFDRRCVECGRMSGSYFILRCAQCGHALASE